MSSCEVLRRQDIWSCGGGTQSGAIAVLIGTGKLPKPDRAFMTDTGRERSGTWVFVDGFIRPQLAKVGLELEIVRASDFSDHLEPVYTSQSGELTVLLPMFTNINGTVGKLSSFCSGKWKSDVGERWMRSVGITHARNWIGISVDEVSRLRNQHRTWLELWYPLVLNRETRMTRARCVDLIRSAGWHDVIPHSACWMCPNASDSEWIDMKNNFPQDFELACAIERQIQVQDPNAFLHPSCVPLSRVEFGIQHTMFADRGCTTGCFT
jgi:hypothetical protein